MASGLGAPIAELGFGGRGVEKHGVGLGWVLGVMGLMLLDRWWGYGRKMGVGPGVPDVG